MIMSELRAKKVQKKKKYILRIAGLPDLDVSDEIDYPIYAFGFIKPHAYGKKEQILKSIEKLSSRHKSPLYVIHEKDYEFTRELAEQHYWVHRDKPFFHPLITMIIEGPTYQFILTGEDAIKSFRDVVGATDPRKAGEHTLRRLYGEPQRGIQYNAIHASDSLASFVREIELHFSREETESLGEHFWKRLDLYKLSLHSSKIK